MRTDLPIAFIAGLLLPALWAQPAAPIPEQLLTAKKVFIGNEGGDGLLAGRLPGFARPFFSGSPDRAYEEFYTALKASGRFELAGTPYDADLVLEIRFDIPVEPHTGETVYDPRLHLTILDPKTHATVWVVTEPVEGAMRQDKRDKNFTRAVAKLVEDLKGLTTAGQAKPLAPHGSS